MGFEINRGIEISGNDSPVLTSTTGFVAAESAPQHTRTSGSDNTVIEERVDHGNKTDPASSQHNSHVASSSPVAHGSIAPSDLHGSSSGVDSPGKRKLRVHAMIRLTSRISN